MKVAIGGDHAGFEYKKQLVEFLEKEGYEVKDFGPDSDASVDYPDHVHPLAEAVEKGEQELGILLCGSANGVAITANKHQGIRAGIAWEDELAALTRQHNNANVICIPARFIDYNKAQSIVKTFLTTEFEGGRHGRRVDKISC
ncbi:ribose 5-phosphate isomerase B [Marivirga salinae]|uniref:Ribose 5-phosphate isomerase B n=1 Tax=Marivirga salinarum TaxID=3059078 RepID=A0AA51RD09_9BACT|nr:ribose 5-phosphate isomerase B [Marivirga sp. BDSF4-3]WMN12453.1 ribose 5-phosphate isomerase B [Marivirga sp. BDSF4-3]